MEYTITVDPKTDLGRIKPLHGVNNSPLSFGGLTDLSRAWKRAGFPFARLHDTDWPHPITIDLPQVFPDFDADETDPANYRFTNTDQTLKKIAECGASIIYRLGTSIEHTAEKVYTKVPADMEKWARICVQVIKHCNEGWADGLYLGIRYWEIWNEADLDQADMWQGTPEEYFDLYVTASKIIKDAFPDLSVGGPALAGYGHADFVNGLLRRIQESGAPLDFFSWHLYRWDPAEFEKALATVRGYLDAFGFEKTILICDEWNYNPPAGFSLGNSTPEEENAKVAYFSTMGTEVGAAFCAAVMTVFQKGPNDIACYYDAQPTNLWCGIFDRYGVPTKSYYAFLYFNGLYRLGQWVTADTDAPDVRCLAATDAEKKTLRLLVSRYMGKEEVRARIKWAGCSDASYTLRRTDASRTDEQTECGRLANGVWEGTLPADGLLAFEIQL